MYALQSLDTTVLAEDLNMKEEQVREEARIYRKETKRPLTPYQKKINDAAEQICLENPSMLRKRNDLIEVARACIIKETDELRTSAKENKTYSTGTRNKNEKSRRGYWRYKRQDILQREAQMCC